MTWIVAVQSVGHPLTDERCQRAAPSGVHADGSTARRLGLSMQISDQVRITDLVP